MNQRSISFPQWKQVLAASSLSQALKSAYIREILSFLKHCKSARAAATVEVAKQYLDWKEKQGRGPAREALRWFYREGSGSQAAPHATGQSGQIESVLRATRLTSEPALPADAPGAATPVTWSQSKRRPMEPPPAASDLGAEPWEKDLIKAIRERGFLWRTEQTYREWAVRFARFIAPRSPYAASGEEVAAFLSALAVQARASPATQKQALNALVFLMQEALHRDLGQMDFKRAYPSQRMPTVLSVPEARSLFAQMNGTTRLMAELAYGSGLRLMELLRLRVHHLDFDRSHLQVFAGKGDRVNSCADATRECRV